MYSHCSGNETKDLRLKWTLIRAPLDVTGSKVSAQLLPINLGWWFQWEGIALHSPWNGQYYSGSAIVVHKKDACYVCGVLLSNVTCWLKAAALFLSKLVGSANLNVRDFPTPSTCYLDWHPCVKQSHHWKCTWPATAAEKVLHGSEEGPGVCLWNTFSLWPHALGELTLLTAPKSVASRRYDQTPG